MIKGPSDSLGQELLQMANSRLGKGSRVTVGYQQDKNQHAM